MEAVQNFLQTLAKMQWSDYLDIVLVAGLIYSMLPLIRTPNMMRLARLVVALIIVAWLTDEMKLHTLSWILNQCLSVGLLAVIILYQQEIKAMLNHLGNVSFRSLWGGRNTQDEWDRIIDQTVMACEKMSREKVGALIVFARTQRLDEQLKTGTVIDGAVSEQLLRNIFFKNSPLHDGALIVQGGKIAAAGCVLPLSNSPHLSADLGTRHRAGVGMSEASDAVLVIVSEENGAISAAVGGVLKRRLSPESLVKLLRQELCHEKAEEEKKTGGVTKKLKKMADKNSKEAGKNEKK